MGSRLNLKTSRLIDLHLVENIEIFLFKLVKNTIKIRAEIQ